MKAIKKNKIIIATGGTGGHVFPAYSLARNFIKKDYSDIYIIVNKNKFIQCCYPYKMNRVMNTTQPEIKFKKSYHNRIGIPHNGFNGVYIRTFR